MYPKNHGILYLFCIRLSCFWNALVVIPPASSSCYPPGVPAEPRWQKEVIWEVIWVFPKIKGMPKASIFNRVFHYKPSILVFFPLFLETPIYTNGGLYPLVSAMKKKKHNFPFLAVINGKTYIFEGLKTFHFSMDLKGSRVVKQACLGTPQK